MYAGRYCSVPRAGSDTETEAMDVSNMIFKEKWESVHKKGRERFGY
jgi:hypothetical protein